MSYAFLLVSGVMLAWASPASAQAKKPNIVVFIADDHGQLDSSVYGAKDVRTPNMQRLAKLGMTFTHAFVASPSCAPSRAAMLTGLMPARNGAEANHTFKRDDVASLPPVLGRAGYVTIALGKIAHGKDGTRHGFDHVDASLLTLEKVAEALKKRDKTRPLCLLVGTRHPHVPWSEMSDYDPAKVVLPPTHVDTKETREMRARYYTDVTKADELLGQVLDLVREALGEDTIFVYTADHGGQWPFGKWNLYDAGIRIPLIVAQPGRIPPASRTDAMVSWIDLLPTLIDLAGAAVPDGLDGKSFAPVLTGKAKAHRDRIFATHTADGKMNQYPIRCVRTKDWHYIVNLSPGAEHTTHIDKALNKDGLYYWRSWEALAAKDAKAAETVRRYHKRPAEELYDLRSDPFALRNLATEPKHRDMLEQLRRELEEWRITQGELKK